MVFKLFDMQGMEKYGLCEGCGDEFHLASVRMDIVDCKYLSCAVDYCALSPFVDIRTKWTRIIFHLALSLASCNRIDIMQLFHGLFSSFFLM